MKNKGFTLTELLVVIAILGIVSGMSMSLIRNLSSTFDKKKYQGFIDFFAVKYTRILIVLKGQGGFYYEIHR